MTLDPQPLAPALAAARQSGRTVVVLDLDGVRTKAALMERCARTLELPQWFGRNWDALADVLTDTAWFPGEDVRVLLAVTGWRGYAQARPGDWETFREVLEGAAEYWASERAEPERTGPQERAGEPGLAVLIAEPGRSGRGSAGGHGRAGGDGSGDDGSGGGGPAV